MSICRRPYESASDEVLSRGGHNEQHQCRQCCGTIRRSRIRGPSLGDRVLSGFSGRSRPISAGTQESCSGAGWRAPIPASCPATRAHIRRRWGLRRRGTVARPAAPVARARQWVPVTAAAWAMSSWLIDHFESRMDEVRLAISVGAIGHDIIEFAKLKKSPEYYE
jgi:hypothetical protein